MGTKNSRVSVWGARIGIVVGAVISLTAGILWGVLASVILTIIISKLFPSKDNTINLRVKN